MKKVKEKLFKKKRGDKSLIIELGLIAVGLALIVIFKNQLSSVITTICTQVTAKISEILSGL